VRVPGEGSQPRYVDSISNSRRDRIALGGCGERRDYHKGASQHRGLAKLRESAPKIADSLRKDAYAARALTDAHTAGEWFIHVASQARMKTDQNPTGTTANKVFQFNDRRLLPHINSLGCKIWIWVFPKVCRRVFLEPPAPEAYALPPGITTWKFRRITVIINILTSKTPYLRQY
jgi:hypothetical protein